jgi:hypothetical protein
MTVCGRVEVSLHTFSIPALYGDEWSDSGLGYFITGNHCTGDWVGINAL